MKVLWFTNTLCLAEDYFNNKSMNGGFLKSLEKAIREQVDLSIAFYYSKDIKPFKHEKTTYYPIYKNSESLKSKIRSRIFTQIEAGKDVKKFIKIVEVVAPDVIHIHGSEGPFGLIQKYLSVPTVISMQGNISVYKNKFFSGIPQFDVFKYTSLKRKLFFTGNLQLFKRFKKQAAREKQIFQLSKNIIGRTNWDRRIAKILSPSSRYFHNDEILKDVFYEEKWQSPLSRRFNLHTTTGSNIYKGIETLIYCAHLLDQVNFNFKWKVAGVSLTDEMVRLSTKSLKVTLSKNIEFLGKADENVLKDSILNCNVYVAISHIENSPNSLCEALLIGAPCIATHAGGTSNFIQDRSNGILIQDGDAYSMAGAITELSENYNFAESLGRNARAEALKRHDKTKIVSDLLSIYQKIND
jgi:glycosyltransferase involved in cell wall biosynthesis